MPFVRSPFRRLLALAAVGALAFSSASSVAAQTYPTVDPDEPGYGDQNLADLVRRVLYELGLEPEVVESIVDDLLDGVTDRINDMVDAGIVSEDQVDTLAELVDEGGFDEVVPDRVEQTRERRDAFRSAAEDLLAELGIDVPDGASIREVLADNDLSREDFAELLEDAGFEPPARPERPDPEDRPEPGTCGESTYPVTGPGDTCGPPPGDDGERFPTDDERRPAPPSDDEPDEQGPAPRPPAGDYPTTEPTPPTTTTPSGDYPTTEPTPTTTPPRRGGAYPTTEPGDDRPPRRDGAPPQPPAGGEQQEQF